MKRLFPTGVPVQGKDMAGRVREKKEIKQLLTAGQSVVLYGPRRIGKTSIALTVLKELKTEGFFTGHIDIFETPTQSILAQKFVETTLDNKKLSKTIKLLKESLSAAISRVEIKQIVNEFEWILKFAETETNNKELLSSALDFPEKYSQKHRSNMIMFIDEIGDIHKFNGGALIKLMRSKFQLHQNVTYLFAGSHEGVMENVFIKNTGPFYRFAQLLQIETIEKDIFKSFLNKRFNKVGISIDESALNDLLNITNGHPFYTQLLCRELYFYALSQEKSITAKAIDYALEEVIRVEDMYYSKLWDEINKNSAQIYILHALVSKVPALFNKERKAKINVTRTLQQLIKRGIINKNNNRMYTFTDPMFRIFIERKFL